MNDVKVLMFGWEFPPHNSGGLGVACKGLVKAMAENGSDVTFVLPRRVDTDATNAKMVFADMDNVDVREIDSRLFPYANAEEYERAWLDTRDSTNYGSTLFEEVARYGQRGRDVALREMKNGKEFDVIHAHDWLSFSAGVEAKKVTGRPLVLHVHATEWDRTGGNVNQAIYDIERHGLGEADQVMAVSEWTRKILIERYGIDGAKVDVVHNGVDALEKADDFPQIQSFKDAGYKIVLFVGRVTIQKGPDYFLQLAKAVTDMRPKTLFLMSGSGDMETHMMREAARLRISDKVLFTGFLRGKDLQSVYGMADLFVMPSVSEPFGITPLESIQNGTPVLISKQSGVSEVLEHALKADFWDVEDMANKVYAVLEHEALHRTLLKNGTKNVFSVTWKKAADKCVSIYHRLLKSFESKEHQKT